MTSPSGIERTRGAKESIDGFRAGPGKCYPAAPALSLSQKGRAHCSGTAPMQYAVTAAFLLAVVAGSFAALILGGYEIARLIAFAL